jgi:hypothetical protein
LEKRTILSSLSLLSLLSHFLLCHHNPSTPQRDDAKEDGDSTTSRIIMRCAFSAVFWQKSGEDAEIAAKMGPRMQKSDGREADGGQMPGAHPERPRFFSERADTRI